MISRWRDPRGVWCFLFCLLSCDTGGPEGRGYISSTQNTRLLALQDTPEAAWPGGRSPAGEEPAPSHCVIASGSLPPAWPQNPESRPLTVE